MLILALCLVFLVVGVWISCVYADEAPWVAGMVLTIVGGFGFLFGLFLLATNPISINACIAAFQSTNDTYTAARGSNYSDLELAAIQTDVAEMNRWLAKTKYFNATLFDIWIPDAIENLEPIK